MGIVSLGALQSDGLHNALPLFWCALLGFAPSLSISSRVVTLLWQLFCRFPWRWPR